MKILLAQSLQKRTSEDRTKSEVSPDDSDENSIDLPNAVAIGDPPNGLDVNGLLNTVGNGALDIILGLPIGWDPDTGTELPGLGSDDPAGGAGDDGNPVGDLPV